MSAGHEITPGDSSNGLSWDTLAGIYPYAFQRIGRMARRARFGPDTADDIAQEVFISALRNTHSFRGDTTQTRIMSWLFGITRNNIAKRIERQKPAPQSLQALQADHDWEPESPAGELEHVEARDTVRWLLERGSITPRALGIVTLKHVHDVPSADIAAIVGISAGYVDVIAHRTRVEMRALLQQADIANTVDS